MTLEERQKERKKERKKERIKERKKEGKKENWQLEGEGEQSEQYANDILQSYGKDQQTFSGLQIKSSMGKAKARVNPKKKTKFAFCECVYVCV